MGVKYALNICWLYYLPGCLPEDEIFMTKRLFESAWNPTSLDFHSPSMISRDSTRQMSMNIRKLLTHPILALGSTVIWGLIEFVALNRLRRHQR